ncbi:unnamed protein product [Adineta steineri]|uniref:Uncharacterized protein n=1 Tax=Adineta steineri TaxID=433720 RepID=A0A819M570_9BILA|nr:unnamed protein product [Adineta steineri]
MYHRSVRFFFDLAYRISSQELLYPYENNVNNNEKLNKIIHLKQLFDFQLQDILFGNRMNQFSRRDTGFLRFGRKR